MVEASLFTRMITGEVPASVVAKGDDWLAILDIFPRRPGHTLVFPVQQERHIAELSEASRANLMDGVAEVQRRLTEVFDTDDFSVVVHDGPTAGQEVPHVHIHVIPRSPGDGGRGLLSMWPDAPPPGGEPDFAGLSELASRLAGIE